jgi:hypothetical protein
MTQWLAISVLYLGFAGVMGLLIRRILNGSQSVWDFELTIGYILLLYFPASVLVMDLPGWPSWLQTAILVSGFCIAVMAIIQPGWIPSIIWMGFFGRQYFALAMLIVALWGVILGLVSHSLLPTAFAATACLAGIASSRSAFQIPLK